ncbi:serine protease [Xanthomonas sp. SHU 166]|uniref:S1 family peptidase n=1 Tax=Xanthomonas sp. SHU 166 TaxID=1591170 RepID=UPI0012FE9E67|nr:serine protease [Xanthomonas sp. SHU 166]
MTKVTQVVVSPLSLATTYIQTFSVLPDGSHVPKSYATGFFVRLSNALLLVTNWHVVTGLDPADPSKLSGTIPHYMKLTLRSKTGGISEMSLPLYDDKLKPRWDQHPEGPSVDLALYPLDPILEDHFHVLDVSDAIRGKKLEETVAKDVFIIGYPFHHTDLQNQFGPETPYYLPIWKRGSIATEPGSRLSNRILLIDSLSRPGMSGAPVVIAQEEGVLRTTDPETKALLRAQEAGTIGGLDFIRKLDMSRMSSAHEMRFSLLGVYSGVIGNSRLEQVALGKCWHRDVLMETIFRHAPGEMPYHGPIDEPAYFRYLEKFTRGKLRILDPDGNVVTEVQNRN